MRYFLISLLLMVGLVAKAGVPYYQSTFPTATATTTLILNTNVFRGYLLIVNDGTLAVRLKVGYSTAAYDGITIPAGGSYEPINAPTNALYIRTSSGTSALTVVQGQ